MPVCQPWSADCCASADRHISAPGAQYITESVAGFLVVSSLLLIGGVVWGGMTGLYFALSDPLPDIKRRLEEAQGKGYQIGVFACWNWGPYTETDGVAFAEWVDARLRALVAAGYVSTVNRPRVQLNNERHEPAVILAMLERWRQLRPNTATSWTCEGMQGGWMDADFVQRVIGYKVRLAPQAYNGAMDEVWDALAVTRDLTQELTRAGIGAEQEDEMRRVLEGLKRAIETHFEQEEKACFEVLRTALSPQEAEELYASLEEATAAIRRTYGCGGGRDFDG